MPGWKAVVNDSEYGMKKGVQQQHQIFTQTKGLSIEEHGTKAIYPSGELLVVLKLLNTSFNFHGVTINLD